eukprot:10203139-Karenia_brevis.AAC.2
MRFATGAKLMHGGSGAPNITDTCPPHKYGAMSKCGQRMCCIIYSQKMSFKEHVNRLPRRMHHDQFHDG